MEHRYHLMCQYQQQQRQSEVLFLRPEPRNGWFGWFLVGIFLWPFLYVFYRDKKAYRAALAEFRHGIQPEWYWQGYHRPKHNLDSEELNAGPSAQSVVSSVLLGLLVVIAVGVVLVGFVAAFI